MPETESENRNEKDTARVEAFSDGVFAIAITLLILEIKVPSETDLLKQGLGHYLWLQWPKYAAYVFTFLLLGIYWSNHHYVFRLYKKTDHLFLLLNVLFLMTISFMPYPTGILGNYITDPARRTTAVSFYDLGMLLPALTWQFIWYYASLRKRLIDPRLTDLFIRYLNRLYCISPLIYLIALIVSFFNAYISLAISVGLTLTYLFPPRKPEYRLP